MWWDKQVLATHWYFPGCICINTQWQYVNFRKNSLLAQPAGMLGWYSPSGDLLLYNNGGPFPKSFLSSMSSLAQLLSAFFHGKGCSLITCTWLHRCYIKEKHCTHSNCYCKSLLNLPHESQLSQNSELGFCFFPTSQEELISFILWSVKLACHRRVDEPSCLITN